MATINQKLQTAVDTAFEVDRLIADLNEQLGILVGDMQSQKRPHEAGMILVAKEPNTFYRRIGSRLQDMRQ